jgi:hypothetical protein
MDPLGKKEEEESIHWRKCGIICLLRLFLCASFQLIINVVLLWFLADDLLYFLLICPRINCVDNNNLIVFFFLANPFSIASQIFL